LADGNPFSWHLYLEAKLIYSSDGVNFIEVLGAPLRYHSRRTDCMRFLNLFQQARLSLEIDMKSIVFDLSTAFLGIRNFSSCFILGSGKSDFSRNVAWKLMGNTPPIEIGEYRILERARLLCTRGYGEALSSKEIEVGIGSLCRLEGWMIDILRGLPDDE
jgi:hypothetical protein